MPSDGGNLLPSFMSFISVAMLLCVVDTTSLATKDNLKYKPQSLLLPSITSTSIYVKPIEKVFMP